MNLEVYHQALLEKMQAEQEKFRGWLLTQPPQEILMHTYEYNVREDFLLAMESTDLEPDLLKALLDSEQPLSDLYHDWSKLDCSSHMDELSEVIRNRAESELQRPFDGMEIRIYQIDRDRDKKRFSYLSLETLSRFQKGEGVDSSIYNCVYHGNVECNGLEDVYSKFNLDRPAEYIGRSLSVSDVVQVIQSETVDPGFYFCDSVGFQKIDFDSKQTQDKSNAIWVLLAEPGKVARPTQMNYTLEEMQRTVGGTIEVGVSYDDGACLVCAEEGKVLQFPLNRAILDKQGKVVDAIAGTCFICGSKDGEFTSLTSEQMKQYEEKFRYPKRFYQRNGELVAKDIKSHVLER